MTNGLTFIMWPQTRHQTKANTAALAPGLLTNHLLAVAAECVRVGLAAVPTPSTSPPVLQLFTGCENVLGILMSEFKVEQGRTQDTTSSDVKKS